MRIIAGKHKGRKLKTLFGEQTRPMMDRMKESVFQIIGPFFDGGIVLDLFGGSGALSLESISRGVSEAYISEPSKEALQIIKSNINILHEDMNIHVFPIPYDKMLQEMKSKQFDIVFLDPPYRLNVIDEITNFLLNEKMMKENAIVICHYPKGKVKFTNKMSIIRNQVYGESEVTIFKNS